MESSSKEKCLQYGPADWMTINIRRWCNYISALGTPCNHQVITTAAQGADLATKYWGASLSLDAVICFTEHLKLRDSLLCFGRGTVSAKNDQLAVLSNATNVLSQPVANAK